ncbi:MAG: CHASE3 domain-containing protein [Nitrospirae bacterium]|nr:CHASE3 domain-containing protein [Nitrospirota bacterium]
MASESSSNNLSSNQRRASAAFKVAIGFVAAFLSLIVIGGLFASALVSKVELSDVAIQAYNLMHQLENLLSDVSDTESAALEYSLAGERHYLNQYEKNLSAIHRDLDVLRQRVADDPHRIRNWKTVESSLQEKLRLLEKLVPLPHEYPLVPGHLIEEESLVRHGKAAMDAFRTAVETMQEQEGQTLDARLREMEQARTETSVRLLTLTLVATGIVGWLFFMVHREMTQRLQAQEALQQSNDQLEDRVRDRTLQLLFSNDRLSALSRQIIQVQERERRRIARDLHDEIGHSLTVVKLKLQEIKDGVGGTAVEPLVHEGIELLGPLLQRVRNLALELRPSLLDELGLHEASKWYVAQFAKRAGLTIKFDVESPWERLPEEIEIASFRVLQEALTNVLKHARATSVTVTLKQTSDSLELKVCDNGVGFSPTEARMGAIRGESFGLLGMEERLRLVAGTLTVVSAIGGGTEVKATISLERMDVAQSAMEGTTT